MNGRCLPVALLAGGLATRLRPITETIPKAMVEVAGKPFIDHQLALFARRELGEVVICLGYRGEQVRAHVGDGKGYGLRVRYAEDGPRLRGTGGALRHAAALLGPAFWVIYGDAYLDIEYRAIERTFLASDALGLMTLYRNTDRWDRSNAVYHDGELRLYDKRHPVPEMEYIDYGATLLRAEALRRLPPGDPADLADLYHALVRERRMIGSVVTRRFYEVGSPAGLAETRAYLERTGQ